MNNIIDITFNAFEKETKNNQESLVLVGAGGDLDEWIDGISNMLIEEKIATGSKETMWKSDFYKLTTTGDRTDLAMVFADDTTLDVGKLAIWRLGFGDCAWGSDYIVNYKKHH